MTDFDDLGHGEAPAQEVLIVTGMSGAGRSTVADVLEDLGWYVVDNLPPKMLKHLVDLARIAGGTLPKLAVVLDVRGGLMFSDVHQMLEVLRDGVELRVVFLTASDQTLVRRFESVRRPHPLQGTGTILDGITAERQRTEQIREISDIEIDTSDLNVHQLSARIYDIFQAENVPGVKVTLMSFGFKYGAPFDADMIADARFLPNPFWIPELKSLNGTEAEVSDYVLAQEGAIEFIDAYATALKPVLAGYGREGKRHATIALGCTGGKHRSVALILALADRLARIPDVSVTVQHRDLGKE